MSGGPSSDGPAPTLPGTGKVSHDVLTPLKPLRDYLGCLAPSSARLQYVRLLHLRVPHISLRSSKRRERLFSPLLLTFLFKADSREPFLQMAQPALPCDGQGLISKGPARNSLCVYLDTLIRG